MEKSILNIYFIFLITTPTNYQWLKMTTTISGYILATFWLYSDYILTQGGKTWLSSGAKMAMNIFVKRVFTIFATNASFLRIIANLQI